MIKVSISGNLSGGRFHVGDLELSKGWTELDPNDPQIRQALITYVPSHIRIHPDDRDKLGTYGLRLEGENLVESSQSNPTDEDRYTRPQGDQPTPTRKEPSEPLEPPFRMPETSPTSTDPNAAPPPPEPTEPRRKGR